MKTGEVVQKPLTISKKNGRLIGLPTVTRVKDSLLKDPILAHL
jgi:hypothetical protein